jgi:hypothetical protein
MSALGTTKSSLSDSYCLSAKGILILQPKSFPSAISGWASKNITSYASYGQEVPLAPLSASFCLDCWLDDYEVSKTGLALNNPTCSQCQRRVIPAVCVLGLPVQSWWVWPRANPGLQALFTDRPKAVSRGRQEKIPICTASLHGNRQVSRKLIP